MSKYFVQKIKNMLQCSTFQKLFLCFVKIDFIKQLSVMSLPLMFDFMKKSGSIVRFGDGEILILENKGAPDYQKYSDELREKLYRIFTSNDPNLLVCIPSCVCGGEDFKALTTDATYFWAKFVFMHNRWLRSNIQVGKKYGNTNISRPWIDFQDENRANYVFQQFRNIFANRDILIVEGEYTKFGVGNDLLEKANSVSRILGPAKNAYNYCDQLINMAAKTPKDRLVIVCLGPAGKIVAYELFKQGFQVWDLGHLDVEYEWYLKRSVKKELIPGKYVNETVEKISEKNKLNIYSYRKQIISRIPTKENSF